MRSNQVPFGLFGALALLGTAVAAPGSEGQRTASSRPNIVIILADDLGFSDLGCYGSEIATPNLDRLAADGLRFTQFYNAARCCPTRAALLTGLYPHQAGVGHMLQDYKRLGYTTGLNDSCVTIAEMLRDAGYATYHVGKWHVGSVAKDSRNAPLNRGFDHAYGTDGGGSRTSYFAPRVLYLDHANLKPGKDFYATDAFSDNAARFVAEHGHSHKGQPFFLHLCYTAPHFPLHARPEDVARYRGKYRDGWDALRARRHARQKALGIVDPGWQLSPRDPVAAAWDDLSASARDEWDLRMAVYAAMIDRMDQGIGRVLNSIRRSGVERNTLVLFLSDNGASAEALDTWPDPSRGHKPGSVAGSPESHRCLEVGWANAANTPFREHKMWVHEGGISTPLIAYWPARVAASGGLSPQVGHVIDLMPTCLELAGAQYPAAYRNHRLTPLPGLSLVPALTGKSAIARTLGWEHEGNRALRRGNWKVVAPFRGDWELFDLQADRTETHNLSSTQPARARELSVSWQQWADSVGVVPWDQLPGSKYKPTAQYRKKSEPVAP